MKDKKDFRKFLLLWATQTLSRLGSSLTPFALILWTYGSTGSALDTALLTVSSYMPYILLSLPVGAFTDRMKKKKVVVMADTAAASCTFMILFLWISGSLELWHLYLLNGALGSAQAFQQPASEVAITLVTPEDGYQKAGSLNAFSNSVINMASPAIATALYATGGLGLVVAADICTFVAATSFLVLFIDIPEENRRGGDGLGHVLSDLKEALGFLKKRPGLLEVILFLSSINFIASIYNAALPALVLSLGSETVLASVQAVSGAAMITGSLIATVLPRPKSRIRAITLSLFFSMGTESFMLSFSRDPFIWCLGAFLGWLFIPIMNANLDVLLRSNIPAVLQGRVYSARNMLQFFTIPLGYLAGGYLVDDVFEPFMSSGRSGVLEFMFGAGKGAGAAFLFFAIGILGVLVCVLFSSMKEMRRLE